MLRTALLGAGGFGRRLAREVADHPDARLAGVVDGDALVVEVGAGSYDFAVE